MMMVSLAVRRIAAYEIINNGDAFNRKITDFLLFYVDGKIRIQSTVPRGVMLFPKFVYDFLGDINFQSPNKKNGNDKSIKEANQEDRYTPITIIGQPKNLLCPKSCSSTFIFERNLLIWNLLECYNMGYHNGTGQRSVVFYVKIRTDRYP